MNVDLLFAQNIHSIVWIDKNLQIPGWPGCHVVLYESAHWDDAFAGMPDPARCGGALPHGERTEWGFG